MNVDQQIEKLKSIDRVSAPPFLMTRIQAKINGLGNQQMPMKWVVGLAASVVLLACLNIWALQGSDDATAQSDAVEQTLFSEMNTYSSNQLYDE